MLAEVENSSSSTLKLEVSPLVQTQGKIFYFLREHNSTSDFHRSLFLSLYLIAHRVLLNVTCSLTLVPAGNPVPEVNQIEWYLNNVRLYQGDENVRFSDNYLTLYRSKVSFVLTCFRTF